MTVLAKIKSFFKRPKGEPKAQQAKLPAEAAEKKAPEAPEKKASEASGQQSSGTI